MSALQTLDQDIRRCSDQLVGSGYCIIPDLVEPSQIEALEHDLRADFDETPFCRGNFYGERTQRFGRLLARSLHAQAIVQHPLIVGIVERILSPWCDTIQLNLSQAIAIHPGELAQMPHRDQDMWRGPVSTFEYLVNVMWPLTRFTRENGATRLWPGSHGSKVFDQVDESTEIVAEAAPGSAILFLGSLLHAAGANRSGEVRRAMIAGYCLGWLKTYENQFLAYPPHVARTLPPELAGLIGYRQHRPNLGNFEGQCPSVLLGNELRGRLAAIDALRPDQKDAVDAYAGAQRER